MPAYVALRKDRGDNAGAPVQHYKVELSMNYCIMFHGCYLLDIINQNLEGKIVK